ncbi:hypothetical protein Prum_074380 [Phytohabitans rumicis]|uniref:Uncharacterized protein n=1 Tax=Phytohabitans rumicis TaxID=1076125 RepID=A0A6V8LI34_9ACTN|nr:hypothetical protein Prum_074380 [Phytohabitans rumicis]
MAFAAFAAVDGVPMLARVAIVMAVAAGGVLGVWSTLSSTWTDDQGVHVRMLWTHRVFAWPDIQHITVEASVAAAAMSNAAPSERAILFDRLGRKVTLPYLDNLNVARHGSSFSLEMQRLVDTWHDRRGLDWLPDPLAADRLAYRAQHGSPWTKAFYWSLTSCLVAMAVIIFSDDNPFPFGPELVLWLPIATYGATLGLLLTRRRRALRHLDLSGGELRGR